MGSDIPVSVIRLFRWRGATQTYATCLLMPWTTAHRLLRARAVELIINHEDDLSVRRYRCRLVRPADHSTVHEQFDGSSLTMQQCG